MSDFIQDGTGTGFRVKVDSKNRLHALSVAQSASTEAAIEGGLFNVNTGLITLTSVTSSSLIYMNNTDSVDWVFSRVFYNAGISTGGSGSFLAEVIANPNGGTLISSGADFEPVNLNFGSSMPLTGTTKRGAEGSTLTGGVVAVETIVPASGARVLIPFDSIIVPPGSSIAIRVTPQPGNTSMDIQVGFNLYRSIS